MNVVAVVIVRFVGKMAAELQFRRQTADGLPGDDPCASKPFRWIAEVAPIRLPLKAATFAVEGNRMHVNPAIPGIAKYTARRQLVHGQYKSQVAQDALRRIQLRHYHHDIQVIMWPCLFAKQRIHAPPAIQPHRDTDRFKAVHDLMYIFCAHHQVYVHEHTQK